MTGLDQIGMLQLVLECFYLPDDSGVPYWRERPVSHFADVRSAKGFNTKNAGTPAGHIREDGRRRINLHLNGRLIFFYGYQVVWALTKNEWPTQQIDHRDRNPSNDAPGNLRSASQAQNSANTGMFAHNTSGFKGVSWDKRRGCWRAYIKVKQRYIHLGYHDGPEKASAAYQAAAKDAFGEFAGAHQ